jgi:hypothetical protein
MNGKVTDEVVSEVRRVLDGPRLQGEWARENFAIGRKHFSLSLARDRLRGILAELRRPLASSLAGG